MREGNSPNICDGQERKIPDTDDRQKRKENIFVSDIVMSKQRKHA
jgi:hypothetical protein